MAPSLPPLTKLLCKGGFWWTTEAEAAFQALQSSLTMTPVLHLLSFDNEFIVECDALSSGFGAMLHHGTVTPYFSEITKTPENYLLNQIIVFVAYFIFD
jgi:hypothetical protein